MLERDLQRKCLDFCKRLNNEGRQVIAINQHGSAFASRGVADILLCIRGKFIAIELKVPGNKPTPLQSHFISKVIACGGVGHVVYTFEAFAEIVLDTLLD